MTADIMAYCTFTSGTAINVEVLEMCCTFSVNEKNMQEIVDTETHSQLEERKQRITDQLVTHSHGDLRGEIDRFSLSGKNAERCRVGRKQLGFAFTLRADPFPSAGCR